MEINLRGASNKQVQLLRKSIKQELLNIKSRKPIKVYHFMEICLVQIKMNAIKRMHGKENPHVALPVLLGQSAKLWNLKELHYQTVVKRV